MLDQMSRRVSVVIPCHSQLRWPQLIAAVDSVLGQRPHPAEVVVAVDHNEELFDRARQHWPQITVVANRFQSGASGNRNTGVLHTRTPLIALLDDDACARDGWLAGMLDPFDDPSVVGTGGAIIPRWERARPEWFPDELLWAVVGTANRDPNCTTVRNVWSASMAVRRDVFDSAGGFRAGFGKNGNRPRPEDTDLCLRMTSTSSGRWVYVPHAVVDHLVPRERATLRSLTARCYHEGRGKVELARVIGDTKVFTTERDYLRRVVPGAVVRGIGATILGRGTIHAVRAGVLLTGAIAAVGGAVVETLRVQTSYPSLSLMDSAALDAQVPVGDEATR
jgi:glycosyltransferase involved in cell wall biosynthesis